MQPPLNPTMNISNILVRLEQSKNLLNPKKTSVIISENIFDPNRGHKEPEPQNTDPVEDSNNKEYELIGICKIGAFSGAVILYKKKVTRRRPSRRFGKSKTPTPEEDKSPPLFYKVGDKLPSGYAVKEIEFAQVVLRADGKSDIVVKLQHDDDGSISRIKAVPAIKPQIPQSPGQKNAPTNKTVKKTPATKKPQPQANSRFLRRQREALLKKMKKK